MKELIYKIKLAKKINNAECRIKKLVEIKDELRKLKVSSYDIYYTLIDILMLLGIEYYLINNIAIAKVYFNKVVTFGEKYPLYSKKNYYDIINCAYSWLAYYSFEDNDLTTAEKYCNIVINNYLEVKDDPNYFVTEKESVQICSKYLDEIKKTN